MKKLFTFCLMLLLLSPCWAGVDLTGAENDGVNFGNSEFSLTQSITVSCWVKYDTLTQNAHANIFAKRTGGAQPFISYQLKATDGSADDSLNFSVGLNLIRSSGNFDVGTTTEWVHILGTWSDGNPVRLWVNNINQVSSINYSGTIQFNASFDNIIGYDDQDANRGFNGKVSEAAIWDVVISDNEIALLANSKVKGIPLQIQPANLQFYAPLDDFVDGTNLNTDANGYKDRSGNGNDGQGVDADTDSLNIAEQILSYP